MVCLVAGSCLIAGCVLPIPATVDEPDAAPPHYQPSIADPNPPMPGPISLMFGSNSQMVSFNLVDDDASALLRLRVFRDYSQTTPGEIVDQAIPNSAEGTATRPVTLPTNTWCNGLTAGTDLHVFTVLVTDGEWEDSTVAPFFQATNGETDENSWVATCN